MQQIEPIAWIPGQPDATQIQVWNITDNLESNCSFGWQLLTAQGAFLDTGTLPCDGITYLDWDGNRVWPYEFVANTIGVVLI